MNGYWLKIYVAISESGPLHEVVVGDLPSVEAARQHIEFTRGVYACFVIGNVGYGGFYLILGAGEPLTDKKIEEAVIPF